MSFGHTTKAQNLVPNPSFEKFKHCPVDFGDIDSTFSWFSVLNSPDYFNPCANGKLKKIGVPYNIAGFQNAYDGKSYSGISTCYITFQAPLNNSREFIGVKLDNKLTIGKKYFLSAYISKGDIISITDTVKCSTNNFGFRFTVDKYEVHSIDNFCHFFSKAVIEDTNDWVRISGSFIADSAYEFLSLGNFFDDRHTLISNCQNYNNVVAYYYIDMVSVTTDSLIDPRSELSETRIDKSISVYPSPVLDRLHIDTRAYTSLNYSIFDMVGTLVHRGHTRTEIDVSGLENGSYMIQLYTDSELYETKRFEVRR